MKKSIIILCIGLVLGLLGGFLAHKTFAKPIIIERKITNTITYTNTVLMPKIVERKVIKRDSILFEKIVNIHDTLYAVASREQIVSEDSTYRVVASGVNPSIDEVSIYMTDRYYTDTVYLKKKTKHWGIGVSAGYGFALQRNAVVASPTISVGVGYYIPLF